MQRQNLLNKSKLRLLNPYNILVLSSNESMHIDLLFQEKPNDLLYLLYHLFKLVQNKYFIDFPHLLNRYRNSREFIEIIEIIETFHKYEIFPDSLVEYLQKHLGRYYYQNKQNLIQNNSLNEIDKILEFSNELMKEKIASQMIFIKKGDSVIGKKIIRHHTYLPKNYTKNENNWIPVWHGTKFESLKSIMKYGLKLPGTKLESGLEIKPLDDHIDRFVTVDNVNDWAKAIFVSPSIFYSANPCYAKTIESNGKEWLILIEARAKIGSYRTRESTVRDYKYIDGEPKDEVEYRIEKESDIIVISICFLEKKFFGQIQNFNEGFIFAENYRYLDQNKDNVNDMCFKKEMNYLRFDQINVMQEDFYKTNYNKSIYHEDSDDEEERDINNLVVVNDIIYNMKVLSINNIYIDSKIIKGNLIYQQKLKQWIEKPNESLERKNISNIELIYRGSRDGFQAREFHNRCDHEGETLVIIQSKSDNYIFGGYTSIDWDSTTWNGKCGKENNARRKGYGHEFVFTLKNPYDIPPSKFNIKTDWLDHSICCDVRLGPIFGCNDIRIENNCDTENNSFKYYDFVPGEYCFNDTTGKKRMLFTGSSTYKVKEIEVFKITTKNYSIKKKKEKRNKIKNNDFYKYDYFSDYDPFDYR